MMVANARGQGRSVYPDDSPAAADALVRVRELHQAGNDGEAVRVLQGVLDVDAERLMPLEGDADVLRTIRDAARDLLLADPALLARYVAEIEPAAAALVQSGDLSRVERTMLLTPAGLEAALRLAQRELEEARFESSRMMLEQLQSHPSRRGEIASRAARLAWLLSGYLPSVSPLAEAWAKEAAWTAPTPPPTRTTPARATVRGRDSAQPGPEPRGDGSGPHPLQSASFEPESVGERAGLDQELNLARSPKSSWIFPTVEGNRVYATDGMRLWARDAFTLAPIWMNSPTGRSLTEMFTTDEPMQIGIVGARGGIEDPATVTAAQGLVIFAGGVAFNGGRAGDLRIHAVDGVTGLARWSTDLATVERTRLGGREANSTIAARGNIVVDGDTVVVAVRLAGQLRRITSLHLVGLDLYTGEVKWTRLLGGYGTNPWGRTATRPEGLVASRGVVYRCDDMGILAAVEAATGRPRWVRLLPTRSSFDFSMRMEEEPAPHAMHVPIVRGEGVYIVEPRLANTPGRVIEVDRDRGTLVHSRQASALAEPDYLIAAGSRLAAVGRSRIAFLPFDQLETATVELSDSFASTDVAGRAVASGENAVLLPLAGATLRIDARDPRSSLRRPMAVSGNLVVAPRDADAGEHLVVADEQGLHTYLDWSTAQRILDRRIKDSPRDAGPVLTYVDLASRVGRAEMVPGLADAALGIIDTTPQGGEAWRSRLHALLAEITARSREAITKGTAPEEAGSQVAAFSRPPIRDTGLLDEVIDRMTRAAAEPSQVAVAAFERAWLRSLQRRHADAVEALQSIILDDALSQVSVLADDEGSWGDAAALGATPTSRPAGELAQARLLALLRANGPAPYAAFDQECAREAAGLAADADAARCERLARRYPAATDAPLLWARAADASAKAGDLAGSRRALGLAVAAAERSAWIGRTGQGPLLGSLTGRLVASLRSQGDLEPAYRLLTRLATDHADAKFDAPVSLGESGPASTPGELATKLEMMMGRRTTLAQVGKTCTSPPQVLGAWEPLPTLSRRTPGSSQGGIVMYDDQRSTIALWAVDLLDGRLRPVWTRKFESRPTVLRLTPQATWLFWPSPGGGVLESVRNAGGSREVGAVLWRTQDTATLLGPAATEGGERFNTPTDGQVRPDDLLALCDESRVVVVQRRGLAACFDGKTGSLAWTRTTEVDRVFEAELCGDTLVVAGTRLSKAEGRQVALLVACSLRDGAESSRLGVNELGDHPRWVRSAGGNAAIVGAASGLLRFDTVTGRVAWAMAGEPARSSVGAWMVGDACLLLTGDSQLWSISTKDGTASRTPVDTRGRLSFPMSAKVNGRTLVISSPKGVAVIDETGRLLGADGLDGVPAIESPEPGAETIWAVESDPLASDEHEPSLRLFCFEHPTGRLLGVQRLRVGERPNGLWLIDDAIIMPCGTATLVMPAPR
jgi:outer membrane protein assembly factor BamB